MVHSCIPSTWKQRQENIAICSLALSHSETLPQKERKGGREGREEEGKGKKGKKEKKEECTNSRIWVVLLREKQL